MELRLPRGMRDFPPEEAGLRARLVERFRAVFERYGFNPLETPVVERWEILAAKYGGGEEILKETFRLKDQGGRDLGLRYEFTTSLARYVGMNPTVKRPFKRYQIGPVYRDGPIKAGRYREFWQCDVDTVGTSSQLADAEFIRLALDLFGQIGFDVEIRVNNRKLLKDLAEMVLGARDERALDFILSLDKLEKVGREGVAKELRERGFTRVDAVFDLLTVRGTNEEKLAQLADEMPGQAVWASELKQLFEYVEGYIGKHPRVRFVPSLARGLGYYTGTIFEVFLADGSFEGSLAAGGRYDNLIGDFLGSAERIPAVGISFGLEPIYELYRRRQEEGEARPSVTQVYVIPIQTVKECLGILERLRAAGICADMDLAGRNLSANLDYADAYRIPYCLLVGPDELAQGAVTLRDMRTGQQETLSLEGAIARLTGNGRKTG